MQRGGALTAEMMTWSLAELFGRIYVMGPMTTTRFPRLMASTSFLRAAQQLLRTPQSAWTRAPSSTSHTPPGALEARGRSCTSSQGPATHPS